RMVELGLRLLGGGRSGDARRRGGGLGRAALGVLVDRVQHGETGRGGRRRGRRGLLGRGGRRRGRLLLRRGGRRLLLWRSETTRRVLVRLGRRTGSRLLRVAVPAGLRRGGGALR